MTFAPAHAKPSLGARPRPLRWIGFGGLLLVSFAFLLPLLWMLVTSLTPSLAAQRCSRANLQCFPSPLHRRITCAC